MKFFKNILLPILLLIAQLNFAQEEISLNGNWEIVFDHDNQGAQSMWHQNEVFKKLEDKRKIKVPSSWELIEKDYEGVAFYRYAFTVPENWEGKVVRLQFDAVNYLSEIWLNNEVVGYHEGGFTPFEFRVDNMIQAGKENILTLRVVGPIILSDKNVKGILINIFGGIMKCDVIADGVITAAKETKLSVPLVVRLAGTNFEQGKKILSKSGLKIIPAEDLSDAAKKIVDAIR